MSTNEELVERIHAGESDCMAILWEQVERLVYWKARRVAVAIDESGISTGIEYDDLCQCGFFALASAVASYRPEYGAFSTVLMLHLKTAFAEATGFRTMRQMRDPLRLAGRLDEPVGKDKKHRLFEVFPDPAAEAMIAAVSEHEIQEQRREAVRAAVAGLPDLERAVLDCRYFQDMDVPETATALGITEKDARKLESNALRYLRHPDRSRKLREFWG